MDGQRAIVIVSGGIDSTVALHLAVRRMEFAAFPLAFNYQQRHVRELDFAQQQCALLSLSLRVIEIPWMSALKTSALTNVTLKVPHIREVLGHPQPSTYVPFRNLLFLTIACQFAEDIGASNVIYGAQLHDLYGYWDATLEFVNRLNGIAALNRLHRIEVLAPLARTSKADNVRLGMELGVNFGLTYSCYAGRESHCGACPTCAERKKAFADVGIPDPTVYDRE